jgi:hypothetical protein
MDEIQKPEMVDGDRGDHDDEPRGDIPQIIPANEADWRGLLH